MEKIELVEASVENAGQIEEFRREIFEHDLDDGNRLAGCMSLEEGNRAADWIDLCQRRRSGSTCKQAGVDVPSHTYFAIRKSDHRLVGVIDLRHHIAHPILGTWGGHCGYSVRPSERGKGYGTEMLRLNLQNAKNLGISRLLVTCYPDNKASQKVILANGGCFEKTITVDGKEINRYWIELSK